MQISLSHPPLLSTHHPPPVRHRPRCCFFVSLFFFFSSSFLSLLLPFPPSSSPHPTTSHHPNLNLPNPPLWHPATHPKTSPLKFESRPPTPPQFFRRWEWVVGLRTPLPERCSAGGVSRGARGDKIAGSIALEIADRISNRRNSSGNLGGKSRGNFRQPAGRGPRAMPSTLPGALCVDSLRLL